MNVVVFSWNFPPLNDAEAYCSARFASALAQAGNDVQVVTMDHPKQVSDSNYKILVDTRIRIVRIPLTCPARSDWRTRLYYKSFEWGSVDFRVAIKTLRHVLRATENPVLVSRANPSSSHVIAWHCRKDAHKWIAHFSDPYPWFTGKSFSGRLRRLVGLHWGVRALRDADAVSVTCATADRFFAENYGSLYLDSKHFVLTHIGEPKLPVDCVCGKSWSVPCIMHAGELKHGRGGPEILSAIKELNVEGFACCFKQVGSIGIGMKDLFEGVADAEIISNPSPGYSTAMAENVDACFIADLDVGIGYSPFLPSKFVYQVFTDTPLVLYTYNDSCMSQYAAKYPEAGLFVAEIGNVNSLKGAVKAALQATRNGIDRSRIRHAFTREKVADDFFEMMSCIENRNISNV